MKGMNISPLLLSTLARMEQLSLGLGGSFSAGHFVVISHGPIVEVSRHIISSFSLQHVVKNSLLNVLVTLCCF